MAAGEWGNRVREMQCLKVMGFQFGKIKSCGGWAHSKVNVFNASEH